MYVRASPTIVCQPQGLKNIAICVWLFTELLYFPNPVFLPPFILPTHSSVLSTFLSLSVRSSFLPTFPAIAFLPSSFPPHPLTTKARPWPVCEGIINRATVSILWAHTRGQAPLLVVTQPYFTQVLPSFLPSLSVHSHCISLSLTLIVYPFHSLSYYTLSPYPVPYIALLSHHHPFFSLPLLPLPSHNVQLPSNHPTIAP